MCVMTSRYFCPFFHYNYLHLRLLQLVVVHSQAKSELVIYSFFGGGVKGATKAIKVSREEDKKLVILSEEQALDEEEIAIFRANFKKLKSHRPSVKW